MATFTYYVDQAHPSASDSNAGTSPSLPLLTVTKGWELATGKKAVGDSAIVNVANGTYRLASTLTLNGSANSASITLQAINPGQVTISGGQVYSSWTPSGSNYYTTWTNDWGNWVRPNNEWPIPNDVVSRREVVVLTDSGGIEYCLLPVATLGELAAGKFYVDQTANRLYLRPPAGVTFSTSTVEIAEIRKLLDIKRSNNVTVKGIVWRCAATAVNEGALHINNDKETEGGSPLSGAGGFVIEDCTVKYSAYDAIYATYVERPTSTSYGLEIRRTTLDYAGNGYKVDRAVGVFVEDFTIKHMNYKGLLKTPYWFDFDAGGKFVHMHHAKLNNIIAEDNQGIPLWFDFNGRNIVVDGFKIINTVQIAIMVEAMLAWSDGTPPVTLKNGCITGTSFNSAVGNPVDLWYFHGSIFLSYSDEVKLQNIHIDNGNSETGGIVYNRFNDNRPLYDSVNPYPPGATNPNPDTNGDGYGTIFNKLYLASTHTNTNYGKLIRWRWWANSGENNTPTGWQTNTMTDCKMYATDSAPFGENNLTGQNWSWVQSNVGTQGGATFSNNSFSSTTPLTLPATNAAFTYTVVDAVNRTVDVDASTSTGVLHNLKWEINESGQWKQVATGTKARITLPTGVNSIRLTVKGCDGITDNEQQSNIIPSDGDFEMAEIQPRTKLGTDQASITISNIPGNYATLLLVVSARTNTNNNRDDILLRFNGDATAGDYYGAGATGGSSGTSGETNLGTLTGHILFQAAAANTSPTGRRSNLQIYVNDYADSGIFKEFNYVGENTLANLAGYPRALHGGGTWEQNSAVTSITLVPRYGTVFKAGTTYALYGIGTA